MAYILGVNPAVLADAGMDKASVFLATAISAGVASIIMGLVANYPVALASGMGVNALFAYTICGQMGFSWAAALSAVFISGIIFILISVTGVRKAIINAIPVQLKLAIGAGIGFFIAFVGLKNAGIIVASPSTFVTIGNLTDPTVLLAIVGLLITIALVIKNVPAAVFVGMVITAVIGIILGFMGMAGMPTLPERFISFDFELQAAGSCFSGISELFANPFQAFVVIFSFLFVDFFDTAGTLVAIGNRIGLINDKGELENAEQALLADAVGTVFGAVLGTSTVTSFVESSSGVGVGGRTGLTACTSGVCFLLAVFLSPLILSTVTNAVTAPALIVVGFMMMQQVVNIDWQNLEDAVPAFICITMMGFAYSISEGISLGIISYVVINLVCGKAKEKKISALMYVLAVLFILKYIFL
mgnify:FL=1